MRSTGSAFPRCRAVADHAVLIEFGDVISRDVHDQVRRLDATLATCPFEGFTEAIPAYTSVLIEFDPLVTDHERVEAALSKLFEERSATHQKGASREVLVCYEDEYAPDLQQIAVLSGLSTEDVIKAHLSGAYSVFMYGFAPGYAYLAGVPEAIQQPRKPTAIRDIPAGSVMIAGPQCLVTTLKMPTGWWIIGRSPTQILLDDIDRPFLFDVGDAVIFRKIDRATFEAADRRG